MLQQKRKAVFVALAHTVGHELVFKHYTNKVVAAKYPDKESLLPPAAPALRRKRK